MFRVCRGVFIWIDGLRGLETLTEGNQGNLDAVIQDLAHQFFHLFLMATDHHILLLSHQQASGSDRSFFVAQYAPQYIACTTTLEYAHIWFPDMCVQTIHNHQQSATLHCVHQSCDTGQPSSSAHD